MGVLKADIRKQIIELARCDSEIGKRILTVVGLVEDDIGSSGDALLTLLVDCVRSFPVHCETYAVFISHLNAHHGSWVNTVITKFFTEFQLNLRNATHPAKVLCAECDLRFLVELANCQAIIAESLFASLEQLAKIEAKHRDVSVGLVLNVLPWLRPSLVTENLKRVETIMDVCKKYLENRSTEWKQVMSPIKGDLKDRLEGAMEAVESLRGVNWITNAIYRVPISADTFKGRPLPMPQFSLVAADMPKKPVKPHLIIRTYDTEVTVHDRFLLENTFIHIMRVFDTDVNYCAQQMLLVSYKHDDFEKVLVDTILSEMLVLPAAACLPFYYIRLLQTIFALQVDWEPMLCDLLEWCNRKCMDFDFETRDVMAEFLALNIHHYKFKHLDVLDQAMKRNTKWAQLITAKLSRLTFYKNLEIKLPETLHKCLPPEPQCVNPMQRGQVSELYQTLVELIRVKDCDPHAIDRYIQNMAGQAGGVEPVLRSFLYAFFQKSSKTPTHASRFMETHADLFRSLGDRYDVFGELVLNIAFDFWQFSPLRLQQTVTELVKYNVVPIFAAIQKAGEVGNRDCVKSLIHALEENAFLMREEGKAQFKAGKDTKDLRARIEAVEKTLKDSLLVAMRMLGVDAKEWLAFIRRHKLVKTLPQLKKLRPQEIAKETEILVKM